MKNIFFEHPEKGYVVVVVYTKEIENVGIEAGDDAERARFWKPEEIEKSGEKLRENYRETVFQVVKK